MKKRIVLAIFCVFFAAVTLLPVNAFAEKELKLASWGPGKHFVAVQRAAWIEEVNASPAVAGKYKIVQYPGGQLYGPKEMHMAIAKGSVDMGVILQPAMLGMVPLLEGAYLPFGLDSYEAVNNAYTGESLAIISKAMEKKRIKLIYTSYLDPVQFSCNKKNIATFEDFKGLRVLSQSPMGTKVLSAMGCAPDTSIPQTEQYMALKRGVSDAAMVSIVGLYFQKFFEVTPYVTKINFSFPVIFVGMNTKKWNKLPKDVQDTMMALGKKQQAITLAMAKGWQAKFEGVLKQVGATVTELPKEERAKIIAAASKIWEEWAAKNGPEAKRLMELNIK